MFRLLVESVRDYAIYLLDPDGTIQSWNAGAAAAQGLHGSRDRRPQLRDVLHARGSRGRQAGVAARARARRRSRRGHRLARAQGRLAVLGERRDHDAARRERPPRRVRQGHARPHRSRLSRVRRGHRTRSCGRPTRTGRPNADSPSLARSSPGRARRTGASAPPTIRVHPDDVTALRDAWDRAKANAGRLEAEFRLRRARRRSTCGWRASALPFLDARRPRARVVRRHVRHLGSASSPSSNASARWSCGTPRCAASATP